MTTRQVLTRRRGRRGGRGGFSLVEVLIGILILAIGLLGLGVVIPLVVREQRLATDATLGTAVAKAAKQHLTQRREFDPQIMDTSVNTAWDMWILRADWSTNTGGREFLWMPWRVSNFDHLDETTGDFAWRPGSNTIGAIPLNERLWPPMSGQVTTEVRGDPFRPQFVWDIVGRRVGYGERIRPMDPQFQGVPDRIQVAIFVRRIDSNIRVERGRTLLETISGPDVHPVAVDGNGRPTRNGRGDYARPILLDNATFAASQRTWITLRGGEVERELAGQIGQRLLDNFGNVYIVQEARMAGGQVTAVRVDPPVPPWVASGSGEAQRLDLLFTPQIPANVSVFTITRPVP